MVRSALVFLLLCCTAAAAAAGDEAIADLGLRAAAATGDVDKAWLFMENARAGTLNESLAARAAIQAAVIPKALRTADAQARSEEVAARAAVRKAQAGRDIAAMRKTIRALKAAVTRRLEIGRRIQNEARLAADPARPSTVSLEALRALLGDTQVFVSYALTSKDAFALVADRTGARLVALGPSAAIRALLPAIRAEDPERDLAPAAARLRALLVQPLALPRGAALLISPGGELGLVPFALLLPDADVTLVPSGTTYALLRGDRAAGGRGVLAVADPEPTRRMPAAPAAREEARRVGNVVLVGKDATETRLVEMLASRPRWRAVHIAVCAAIDRERPMLSALRLGPDLHNDGHLTVLEILLLPIATDLVVLSGSETASGKVVAGEGIVGFGRAFFLAGARRVIGSLWNADDVATSALMRRFHELWNPKGGKGVEVSAALRTAQAYVRSRKGWEHPYYWAGWVLWGQP